MKNIERIDGYAIQFPDGSYWNFGMGAVGSNLNAMQFRTRRDADDYLTAMAAGKQWRAFVGAQVVESFHLKAVA